ncbi:hypothetical protein NDU88_008472 [Pleurodeles waltl]|uniref:Uncharacterized protein n=1 Tax=Pleurodeles waltl TaxID=8319 RepID=A0AAV7PP88_PLEWA|nr:hypothetical protein NDU88_008472 [Pleurodeles waltl]
MSSCTARLRGGVTRRAFIKQSERSRISAVSFSNYKDQGLSPGSWQDVDVFRLRLLNVNATSASSSSPQSARALSSAGTTTGHLVTRSAPLAEPQAPMAFTGSLEAQVPPGGCQPITSEGIFVMRTAKSEAETKIGVSCTASRDQAGMHACVKSDSSSQAEVQTKVGKSEGCTFTIGGKNCWLIPRMGPPPAQAQAG